MTSKHLRLEKGELFVPYLSRVLGPSHSVLRASVITGPPVEVELLEPVGAGDGASSQSCPCRGAERKKRNSTAHISDAGHNLL